MRYKATWGVLEIDWSFFDRRASISIMRKKSSLLVKPNRMVNERKYRTEKVPGNHGKSNRIDPSLKKGSEMSCSGCVTVKEKSWNTKIQRKSSM